MDVPVVPDVFWQSLVAMLAAATVYLGVLTRKASKPIKEPGEALRKYIDERAEHKINNAVGALLPRLMAPMQTDMGRHSTRLDGLGESEKDHGERLVGLETQVEGMEQRMDARDKLTERDRADGMATMARIEKKVDFLITGKMSE